MTTPNPRTKELAAIHVAKRDLHLSDDEYRDILFTVARVKSASDLDHAGRKLVLDHFRNRGALGGKTWRRRPDDPMLGKLKSLWLELHAAGKVNHVDGLDAWVKRTTRVSSPIWLNSKQMTTCIEALKKWLKR